MMADVVLISGSGPYADRWHPFPATSGRIAGIIDDLGYTVKIIEDVEACLTDPEACRLLVINIGNPSSARPPGLVDAARAGLEKHLSAGRAILGVHSSATSLTTMPEWPVILGGRWVRGRSMHPPKGVTSISITTADHPITSGLTDFVIFDERYSYLETQPDITVLCEHSHDALRLPLDRYRVVYDGLGHDTASYDSTGHVRLLRRIARWLLPA
jgi:hypothetical protein